MIYIGLCTLKKHVYVIGMVIKICRYLLPIKSFCYKDGRGGGHIFYHPLNIFFCIVMFGPFLGSNLQIVRWEDKLSLSLSLSLSLFYLSLSLFIYFDPSISFSFPLSSYFCFFLLCFNFFILLCFYSSPFSMFLINSFLFYFIFQLISFLLAPSLLFISSCFSLSIFNFFLFFLTFLCSRGIQIIDKNRNGQWISLTLFITLFW